MARLRALDVLDRFARSSSRELYVSLFKTFFARGVASFGGLLLLLVLGRLYGAGGVGVFALAQSIYLGAAILGRYGTNNALIRFVGQDSASGDVVKYLRWALERTLFVSVLASLFIYFLRYRFAEWFDAPLLYDLLPSIALATVPFTLAFVLAGFMKGIGRPASACFLENGSIALLAVCVVLPFEYFYSERGVVNAGWAVAFAAWMVVVQGLFQSWRWIRAQQWKSVSHGVDKAKFFATSRAFFVASFSAFMQQVGMILVAGLFLSNQELGIFRAVERSAILVGFVLMVLDTVFPARFASFYHRGDMEGLQKLARKGAALGGLAALPALIVCFVFPHYILGLFGEEFSDAGNLLRIVAFAQFVNVATGSVGFILNMTGHEIIMRNISLLCNFAGLILVCILSFLFGAIGAVLALAITVVAFNLVALYFVWRKLGLWVLPIKNPLNLLRN